MDNLKKYIDKLKNILKTYPRLLMIFGVLIGIFITCLLGSIFIKNNNKINYDSNLSIKESNNKNEDDVIKYFSDTYNMINESNKNDKSMINKIKDKLEIVSDFLFDNGKIYGYTYKDLSYDAKLKINKLLLDIDEKIDEKFPNYKNKIKRSFKNLKSKVALLYIKTVNDVCKGNRKDLCNEAKRDFNKMKKTISITFSMIKDIVITGKTDLIKYIEQ